MRSRRLRKQVAELEVTAFINLVVVLVPFLLATAVFTRLAVLDLSLPAQSSGAVEQLKVNDLKLEIVIRPDALEVGDRIGGLIQRIPVTEKGHDIAALSALLQAIKAKFPDTTTATLLAQPDTPYQMLIELMDAAREAPATVATAASTTASAKAPALPLFPDISIGDAPISVAQGAAQGAVKR